MINIVRNKNTFFEKLVNVTLLLCPILQIYGFGKFDFAFIWTLLLAFISLFKGHDNIKMPKLLVAYLIYSFIIFFLSIRTFEASSVIPLGLMRTTLVYVMFFKWFNYDLFKKYYEKTALICITFFLIQEIEFYTIGQRVSGLLDFLPFSDSLRAGDSDTYYANMSFAQRSSSFFSEPAHFVQFLLPLLAIELFNKKRKFSKLLVVMIIITLLLLQSGNAMLGLVAIGGVFLIKILKEKKLVKKVIVLSVLLISGSYTVLTYMGTEMGQKLMERSEELDSNSMEETSGFQRIYRGYFVFDEYNFIEKVIGIHSETGIEEKLQKSKVAFTFGKNERYFNTVQNILLKTGYLGCLILILLFFKIWRGNNYAGKAIILTFTLLSFVSSLYMSMYMLMYILLSYTLKLKSSIKNEKS
ncbi:MAG: hypothetical protein IJ328_00065 [Muribaculaceae bacterium]|nr:hypothetical protein [Muribaculaceae bacterium]